MVDPALDQQIEQWDHSASVAQQIAADLAIGILSSRVVTLPTTRSLAREWSVSERTVRRAMPLLAEHGLVKKDRTGRYYLAT